MEPSGSRAPVWPWIAGLATMAAVLFTARVTLRDFPNSADEYSYLLSAELFAHGRLSVPSPEPREFFDFIHVINDGRFYGKYPPGWPLILSLGVLAGIPGFVAVLLTAAFLALLYRFSSEHFSREEAALTMSVALFNPFLVFNGASFFSHMPCLFFCTLALYFAFRILREPVRRGNYVALGVATAVAFLIRAYTSVALLAPVGVYLPFLLARHLSRCEIAIRLLCAAAPVLAGAALLALYNLAQGAPAVAGPYAQYSGFSLGWTEGAPDGSWVLRHNLVGRLVDLTTWIPLSGILLVAVCADRTLRGDPKRQLLLVSFAGLFGGYFIFLYDAGNQYGPRYLFEAAGAVMLLLGGLLRRLGKIGIGLAAVIVAANLGILVRETGRFSNQVRDRIEVYEAVKRERISRAIVFLSTGSGTMPPGDLTRNGITFDGDVLYVHDRGPDNPRLLERHPGRRAYFYTFDAQTRTGRLTPY